MKSLFYRGLPVAAMLLGGGLLACCTQPAATTAAEAGRPGWTGRTTVIGNNSTVEGDAQATYFAQKWPYGGRR